MLRRALAVAFAATSLALVPTAASATPEQAPVENYKFTQYSATATVVLASGRTAEIDVMEVRGTGQEVRASVSVRTYQVVTCPEGWVYGAPCTADHERGYAPLSDEQYEIDPALGSASVDATVLFVDWAYGPGGYTRVEQPVTISAVLTGTGPVSQDASHVTECPMGGECQNVRVDASRAALSRVTYDGEVVIGEGRFFRGHSVNAAAPKFPEGY